MIKVAIFASGTGTNALNLMKQVASLKQVQVPIVIVDREESPLPEKVRQQFPQIIPLLITPSSKLSTNEKKQEHETRILTALQEHQIEWCFLAGYMRILGPTLLNAFQSKNGPARIVNIHPSLLPAYPGTHSYERAFHDEVKESGVTIHFVDQGVDTGPILLQKTFPRLPTDTLETFQQRGLELEWQLYADTLRRLDEKGTLP